MDKLRKHIRAEGENVEIALGNLKQTIEREEKTVIELAAIGTFLQNIYNGVENILKQIIVAKGGELPMSGTWHKDLLNLSASMGIVSEELSDELYRYLTFRHFFVHVYGFMIEETHPEDLVIDIPEIWSQFLSETENYLKE
ncbi:MAG: hypothetical protein U9N36_03975 [Euryarchaeota archaeon]|nr:hypothetical protein [Euryarchaeota archaeon]